MQNGLKLVALIKIIRGTGALSMAASLFWGSQQDLSQMNQGLANYEFIAGVARLVSMASTWLPTLSENHLLSLSILALLFSFLRFSEAIGIWFNQSWAEWLAVITGLSTALLFTKRLLGGFEWIILILLTINIIVILYLLGVLYAKRYLN